MASHKTIRGTKHRKKSAYLFYLPGAVVIVLAVVEVVDATVDVVAVTDWSV